MAVYLGELIGEHESILQVKRLIARVARSPARTVLIYGETGTGKGLVARMLHAQSGRARHPFVDINCAAIPESLLESEMFGHERGAFTGAAVKKTGLVEAANGGTAFLDEIREMDMALQAKLLGLLDTQRFRRVGSVDQIEVDVRFIATTNKILLSEVRDGKFREDLYYRLQVVSINLPALHERGSDVLVLADHYIRKFNARYSRSITGLHPDTADIFLRYNWPGNVRELENLLERIFILEDENTILTDHLPDRILRSVRPAQSVQRPLPQAEAAPVDPSLPFHDATAAFQRQMIAAALSAAGGNLSETARRLGLSRHALRHQMAKLGVAGA